MTAAVYAWTSTTYSYTRDGLQDTITGPDGEQWSYAGSELYIAAALDVLCTRGSWTRRPATSVAPAVTPTRTLLSGFLPAGKLGKLAKLLGEGHLSKAVQLQRLIDKKKSGNYASALLEDGTMLVAHSDSVMHSEEYLLSRAGDRKIVAAYSEREPCGSGHNCASQLRAAGVKNVSWSFEWNGIGDSGRAKSNKALADAVRDLFKGK